MFLRCEAPPQQKLLGQPHEPQVMFINTASVGLALPTVHLHHFTMFTTSSTALGHHHPLSETGPRSCDCSHKWSPPTWLPPDVVFAGAIPYRSSDTTWANFPTAGLVDLVLFWGEMTSQPRPPVQSIMRRSNCLQDLSSTPAWKKKHSFSANGNGEVRGKAMWMVKLQNKLCNYTWLKHISDSNISRGLWKFQDTKSPPTHSFDTIQQS